MRWFGRCYAVANGRWIITTAARLYIRNIKVINEKISTNRKKPKRCVIIAFVVCDGDFDR